MDERPDRRARAARRRFARWVLRESGQGAGWSVDEAGFAVVHVSGQRVELEGAYQACRGLPEAERLAAVRRHLIATADPGTAGAPPARGGGGVVSRRLWPRVRSRAQHLAYWLERGFSAAEAVAWSTVLGPRFVVDIAVFADGGWLPLGPQLASLALDWEEVLEDAMAQAAGRSAELRLESAGVGALKRVTGPDALLALLRPPDALGLVDPVALALRHDTLLVAPGDDVFALTDMVRRAEALRDDPDVVCLIPMAPQRRVRPGAFPWAAWRPGPYHPLRDELERLQGIQDIRDYGCQTEALWSRDGNWAPLGLSDADATLGRMVTVATWGPCATILPAADVLQVALPDGRVFRIWADEILDVMTAESTPVPDLWPPRFATRDAFPSAQVPRLEMMGELVGGGGALPAYIEET